MLLPGSVAAAGLVGAGLEQPFPSGITVSYLIPKASGEEEDNVLNLKCIPDTTVMETARRSGGNSTELNIDRAFQQGLARAPVAKDDTCSTDSRNVRRNRLGE